MNYFIFSGDWNVRADLDNFLILIIPTQAASSTSSSPSLLDFLTKSLPSKSKIKHIKNQEHTQEQDQHQAIVGEETLHFIESKTAPYHVDISESKLSINPTSESTLIARSPAVNLSKSERLPTTRTAKALIFAVPEDEEFVVTRTEDKKKVVKKDGKKAMKNISKPVLTFLNAEVQPCGPGMVRDSYGDCITYSYKKNL